MVVITPLRPRGEPRHAQADLAQHGSAVDGVESIVKVDLQEAFVDMARVTLHPLPGSVDGGFRA